MLLFFLDTSDAVYQSDKTRAMNEVIFERSWRKSTGRETADLLLRAY